MIRYVPACWLWGFSLMIALGVFTEVRAQSSSEPAVQIRFLGGVKKKPLAGLTVRVRSWEAKRNAPTKVAKTNRRGVATFTLPKGKYRVDVTSEKQLPYLHIPIGYPAHPFGYRRSIVVKATKAEEFQFNLADACEFVLRAVDVETCKGIPGVVFETENVWAEQWAQAINGDNVGASNFADSLKCPQLRTDKYGTFRRFLGPRPGYKYGVWSFPKGYEVVGKRLEVELKTPVGAGHVEYIFRLRKKGD